MQYLLMIYVNEATRWGDEALVNSMRDKYATFTRDIIQSGEFKGGDGLLPSSTATTVRVRNGKPLLTDGPFAETREQLAGYYLIEAPNLDAATAIAARIPDAEGGAIEVRPIRQLQQEEVRQFGRAS